MNQVSLQAFDLYATAYDEHFTHSLIGKAQRDRVYKWLNPYLDQRRGPLLELNCGTGEDAVYISKKGIDVTACDISNGMIRVASQKDKDQKIRFIESSIQNIDTHIDQQKFTYVFSDFGGLNCLNEKEFHDLSRQCLSWLNPGGYFIAVIMGRKCWWERFFYTWKGEKEKARRRTAWDGVDTVIGESHFKTWYYAPHEIQNIFGDDYRLIEHRPIGLFVPPSYLEEWIVKRPGLFKCLSFLERIFGNWSSLCNYADHYLIVLQKKQI